MKRPQKKECKCRAMAKCGCIESNQIIEDFNAYLPSEEDIMSMISESSDCVWIAKAICKRIHA